MGLDIHETDAMLRYTDNYTELTKRIWRVTTEILSHAVPLVEESLSYDMQMLSQNCNK